ncbi:site-specific integrase [Burkholderia sp. LMG 21824]|uniref:site-specific integrase n=1 Tax=Burkholderia sp. LMG 21824 TaxID=3158172 RepID=UPI003C2CC648
MATYTTRNGNTRAYVRKLGQSLTATFDTRIEAESWAESIEARIIAGEVIRRDDFGENPPVTALLDRYIKEVSPGKGSYRFEKLTACRMMEYDTFKKRVLNFMPADLRAYRDMRLNGDPKYDGRKICGSSCIRELSFLSSVFTHAIKEWGVPLKQNPVSLITLPKKNPARTRRVTDDDIAQLAAVLDGYDGTTTPKTSKQWVMWGFLFAIETAMRRGEFCNVTWGSVHLDKRYIHLAKTKNGDAREVPLSKRALALLMLLPKGTADQKMFKLTDNRYTTLFCAAKKKCGLGDLHGHDSRREAATRVAKKLKKTVGDGDVALLKLSAFTGHKSLAMLKIYFNMTGTEMADALDALDAA